MSPLLPMTAAGAAAAYAQTQQAGGPGDAPSSFGAALQRAAQGAIDAGHQADAQAAGAITGTADLTEVAAAVSRADLALQGATAIRDRMVQAYQDVMRMPI